MVQEATGQSSSAPPLRETQLCKEVIAESAKRMVEEAESTTTTTTT